VKQGTFVQRSQIFWLQQQVFAGAEAQFAHQVNHQQVAFQLEGLANRCDSGNQNEHQSDGKGLGVGFQADIA
jgi:hypothetical protein